MLKWLLAPLRDFQNRRGTERSLSQKMAIPIESMFGGLLANGMELSKFSNYEDYLRLGSKKCWATFKSCDLIGKVVMDTPYQFTRRGGDGEAVTTSKCGVLLANPNPFETLSEMLYKLVFHLKLTGNAYIAKDEANAAGDRPKAIFLLNPKNVRLVIDPKKGLIGYLYRVNGIDVPYDVNEIMHFRNPHPNNDFYGLGDVEAAEDLFKDFLNRNAWSEGFWRNGAAPSGLLICEDLVTDRTAFEEAKRKWMREYGGKVGSGKTAWLTGKWRYEQLGLTAAEMQNIESTTFSLNQIFHLHGVPLSVVGIQGAANFATARVDDMIFRRYTIKPICKLIRDTLQSDLVLGFDPNLDFDFIISGLIDVEQIVATFVPLFDRGVMSINEIRVSIGMTPKTDEPIFDQHFMNAGLVPLELSGVANQEDTEEQASATVRRFMTDSIASRSAPTNGQ